MGIRANCGPLACESKSIDDLLYDRGRLQFSIRIDDEGFSLCIKHDPTPRKLLVFA